MKLLLDQNLSRRLVKYLEEIYPEITHLTALMTEDSDDSDIWSFAKKNDFIIVTKDDDFEKRSILLGHPPKIIWIRLGNCKTSDVVELMEKSLNIITAFNSDKEKSILPIP